MKRDLAPEELLLLVSAEVGLNRAIDVLEGERDRMEALAEQLDGELQAAVDDVSMPAADGAGPAAAPLSGPDAIGRATVELPDGINKLKTAEAAAVKYAIAFCKGNKSAAARLLGVERKAVERRFGRVSS